MKKLLICPICLMSVGAVASTTFYYDTTGQCSTGLFLNPNATSCSQAVTKIVPPTVSGRSFKGYWANGTQVIDSSGNILVNSSSIANLFNNADTDDRHAVTSWRVTGKINVSKHTIWAGNQSNWYQCGGVQNQWCDENDVFYLPYGTYCNTFGKNPNTWGRDYVFNSWRMANGVFKAASSTSSWVDCYTYGVGSPQNYGQSCTNNVSYGDSRIPGGCDNAHLDPVDGVSQFKIYPFACKLFQGTRSGSWTDSISVNHGVIKLDNTVAGKCTYSLICDDEYEPSTDNWSVGCIGLECKSYNNVNLSFLQGKGLTATCVKSQTPTYTCPTVSEMPDISNGIIESPGNCQYRVVCDSVNNFTCSDAELCGSTPLSCENQSTCNNLKTKLQNKASTICKQSCPSKNSLTPPSGSGVSVIDETSTTSTCSYTLGCSSNGYTLSGGNGEISCNRYSDCKVSALNSKMQGYSCTAPVVTCPDAPAVPGGNGNVPTPNPGNNGSCTYSLNCTDGYAMPSDENPNPTYTCQYNSCNGLSAWATGLQCKKQITCPASKDVEHGQVVMEYKDNKTACHYTIDCNSPAYVCNEENFEEECHDNAGHTCYTVGECNTFLNFTRGTRVCVFSCPDRDHIREHLVPHASNIGLQEISNGDGTFYCKYTFNSCDNCFQLTGAYPRVKSCYDTDDESDTTNCNYKGSDGWYTGVSCERTDSPDCPTW